MLISEHKENVDDLRRLKGVHSESHNTTDKETKHCRALSMMPSLSISKPQRDGNGTVAVDDLLAVVAAWDH